MKLLHIVATSRGEKSRTLRVSRELLQALKSKNPSLEVETLNLYDMDLPEVREYAVENKTFPAAGPKGEADSAWSQIEALAKDFAAADAYLITSPMWNFSVPYKLKHYIDVIVQAGILFQFTETGAAGLLQGKKMFCVTSRGSDYSPGSDFHPYDQQEPYLKTIFGFCGIYDIQFVHAQPMDYTPDLTEAKLQEANAEAIKLAESTAL